jgi:hypothetical protein
MFTGGQKEFTQIPKIASGLEGTESDGKQLVSKEYADNISGGASAVFAYVTASGNNGGTATASSYNLRPFNTQKYNTSVSEFFSLHKLDISGGYSQLPVEGEILTGGTSGATGTAHFVDSTSSVYVRSVTGTFSTSENVTGSAGANFNLSSAAGFTNYVGILNTSGSAQKYKVSCAVQTFQGGGTKARISYKGTDTSGATGHILGRSHYSGGSSDSTRDNYAEDLIELAGNAARALWVATYATLTQTSNGLGRPTGAGDDENFGYIKLQRGG